MKVYLIYPQPDVLKSHRFGYSLLLLYLASTLRNGGYEISLIDFSFDKFEKKQFISNLDNESIIIIEVDAFPLKRSSNLNNAVYLVEEIKNNFPNITIIALGKQCTLSKKPFPKADFTILGDPELSILDVVHSILQNKIKKNVIDVKTIDDLSLLPTPAYDLLTKNQIRGKNVDFDMRLRPSALLETSRGCPGACTFCQRKGWNDKLLFVPIDKVVTNFKKLLDSGIVNFWIVDENFSSNLSRSKEVLKSLAKVKNKEIKISLSSWLRIDKEFLDLAKEAGVSCISFGIESTYDANQIFYKKKINLNSSIELLSYADRIGLYLIGNFIIGSPFDTKKILEEQIDLAINSSLDQVNVKILDYMIGSELFDKLPIEKKDKIHIFASKEEG